MNTPSISVCIAAHNAEKHLEATLRSVLAQTFKQWELIVTEDGSADRTEAFVQDFSSTVSQHVVYNRHDTSRGEPATRNTGIATATGEWVAFLDADDLWKPDHLESLLSATQIEDCDAVYAGSVFYDNATWAKLSTRAPYEADLADLPLALYTGRLSIMPSAVMVKREALDQFGPFSTDFPHCSDTEYWLRILSKGGRLFYSGSNTCIYRQHADTPSAKTVVTLIESARVCEHYARWAAIPRSIARTRTANLYRWGGRLLINEDPAAALDSLSLALGIEPLNPKTLALWARAFLQKSIHRRRAA
jgi:glycosyltransferase involved in cell wall biosynthesis